MTRLIYSLFLMVLMNMAVQAQAPALIPYQAVALDAARINIFDADTYSYRE